MQHGVYCHSRISVLDVVEPYGTDILIFIRRRVGLTTRHLINLTVCCHRYSSIPPFHSLALAMGHCVLILLLLIPPYFLTACAEHYRTLLGGLIPPTFNLGSFRPSGREIIFASRYHLATFSRSQCCAVSCNKLHQTACTGYPAYHLVLRTKSYTGCFLFSLAFARARGSLSRAVHRKLKPRIIKIDCDIPL